MIIVFAISIGLTLLIIIGDRKSNVSNEAGELIQTSVNTI